MVRKWKHATMGGGGDYHHQPRHGNCVALSLFILVSATLAFLAYVDCSFPVPGGAAADGGGLYQWWRWQGSAGTSGELIQTHVDGARSGVAARTPTSLSHIVFGIGGAARTWGHRRGYVELWWRPGQTRGHVWLDKEPAASAPTTSPPYRVSADASRFGRRASASRMARIVAESFAAVVTAANGTGEAEDGGGEVRWFVMGDDDTVFFPDNLVTVLRKYDHEEMYYVGAPSESVAQNAAHSYGMAFGGGGFAVSYPAAAELAKAMDRDGGCLDRYRDMFGSDERIHACLSELGVLLTREPGFHQLDFRGDAYGLLAAHPVAPLVSLHHLDLIQPISPHGGTSLDAVRSLVDASRHDPARTLQQAICYHHDGPSGHNWSVSVAWGYTAQVYPWAVPAHELEAPLQTFEPLRKTTADGLSFVFNTRPWRPADSACARPLTFFLSRLRNETAAAAAATTVTEYTRHADGKTPEKECDMPGFRSAAAIQTVRVLAPRMDPSDWHRAHGGIAARPRGMGRARFWRCGYGGAPAEESSPSPRRRSVHFVAASRSSDLQKLANGAGCRVLLMILNVATCSLLQTGNTVPNKMAV